MFSPLESGFALQEHYYQGHREEDVDHDDDPIDGGDQPLPQDAYKVH